MAAPLAIEARHRRTEAAETSQPTCVVEVLLRGFQMGEDCPLADMGEGALLKVNGRDHGRHLPSAHTNNTTAGQKQSAALS